MTEPPHPRAANRIIAVLWTWLGAFLGGLVLFTGLAITGQFDPLLGGIDDLLVIGAFVSGVVATVLMAGAALAAWFQPDIAMQHRVRLNCAMAVSGAIAFGVFGAFTPVMDVSSFLPWVFITIVLGGVIPYTMTMLLIKWKYLGPPHRDTDCPYCGYPVGTSPVCTECGKPVIQNPAAVDSHVHE